MRHQDGKLLFFRRAVCARICVEARVGEPQAFDGQSTDDMRVYDFIDVRFRDVPVPNCFRIDDYVRPVLALVEAAGLIGAHPAFQSALGKFLLEEFLQPRFCSWIAASSGMAGWTLISADEDMFFKFWHQAMVGMLLRLSSP
jgi:hypothetical protein